MIRTPDQRVRVFVSSTLRELAAERRTVRAAIEDLHLIPVMFELGARPHPPRDLYRAYLDQSDVFVGVYAESYGWIGPDMDISGLEDEYLLSGAKPRLIYVKSPAPAREARLEVMLEGMRSSASHCYKEFATLDELRELVAIDLALLLSERFDAHAALATSDIQSAETRRGNLPGSPTPLIGREAELEAASSLLLSDNAVLVTLVGTGGCGKTRLALEIGRRLQDRFPDGVFLAKLEAITDPKLVVPTIAAALGLSESVGGTSVQELVRRHLCEHRVLLVLDNFEQVLEAAREIADVLEACPVTKLLATSRAPLRIRAERVLTVLPLETPPPLADIGPEELARYPAVQLFVERTRAVKPDFALSPANFRAVADICQRLDGLPLALELAAARGRIFPPAQLLTRLDKRFDVLRGGPVDAPERQSTLYRAIDWSHNLLSESERKLFRRLSVFSGGFTLEAVEKVCAADAEAGEALAACEALVDDSLLWLPNKAEERPRLSMLETIREFSRDRLLESAEVEEIGARHAHYFLSLAESAETEPRSAGQPDSSRLLEDEHDNLRAAMSWGLAHQDHELTLRIATALWMFWWGRGLWREGLDWLDRGLDGDSEVCPRVRARALIRIGWLRYQLAEIEHAMKSLREGISLSRKSGDRALTALALSNLGAVLTCQGKYGEAVSTMEKALGMRRELGITAGVCATLINLGMAEAEQGHDERAVELFSESLSLARAADDDYNVGLVLLNLAELYIHKRAFDLAESCYVEADLISQRQGNRIVAEYIARGRGLLALRRGDLERASLLLTETTLGFQQVGDSEYVLLNLEMLAEIAGAWHDWQRAASLLGAGEGLRQHLPLVRQPRYQADVDSCLAAARDALGEAGFAEAYGRGYVMTLEEAVGYAASGHKTPEKDTRDPPDHPGSTAIPSAPSGLH